MKYYKDVENLMSSCIYQTNTYIKNNGAKNDTKYENITICISDYLSIDDRKEFLNKSLKEIVEDGKFLNILKDLMKKDLKLELTIKCNKPEVRDAVYLCCYDDYIKFFDVYGNEIIFRDLECYSIHNIKVLKLFKNQLEKLKLKDYIEQIKDVEVMKYFKHTITISDEFDTQIYLVVGNECKTYSDYELEQVYSEEELNKLLEYEIIDVNLDTE